MKLAFLLPVALAGFAAGCTQPSNDAPASAALTDRECFRAAEVNGYHPRTPTSVDVQVGASRYYRLELQGTCPNVDWSNRVALKTLGGSSWICQGNDAEIIVPNAAMPDRCLVEGVRRLSDEEVKALKLHP
jgi:Family of unknown function (DUF6491)